MIHWNLTTQFTRVDLTMLPVTHATALIDHVTMNNKLARVEAG
jgi:hypothetical protein